MDNTKLDDNGFAKWFILPPLQIQALSPYKRLKEGTAVAGLKGEEVYVLDREYKIYKKWEEVKKVNLKELLENTDQLKDDIVPRTTKQTFKEFGKLYRFNGWEHHHFVDPSSDLSVIRLHIFFRNVRTVAVCQQAKAGNANVEIINN